MTRASTARNQAKTPKKAKTGAANSAVPVLASKLAKALHALARDLPNPADESTDYFQPFVAPMLPETELNGETFQRALNIGSRYKVDLSPAEALLSGAEDADNWGKEIAQGFQLLEKVMRATLSDLSVASARVQGVVRVRMWLFGRLDDGSLVGLRSISTET